MPGQGQSRQSIQSAQRQLVRRNRKVRRKQPTAQQVNAATNPRPRVRVSRPARHQEAAKSRAVTYQAKPHHYKPVTAPVNAPREQKPKRSSQYVTVPQGQLIHIVGNKAIRPASVTRQQAARLAPVLSVLGQLSRGYHASAGAADELAKGHGLKGALSGAEKGLIHNRSVSYSNVLKDAGVKNKAIRSIGGFIGDVALDPTTYVTGGTGSLAEKAAARAATRTEKAAAKAAEKAPQPARQVTAKEARRAAARAAGGGPAAPSLAERAAARALREKPQTKGVVLKVAGREVKGVRTVTAHASRPVRAAGRKAASENVRAGARAKAADVNPNVAPVGVGEMVNRQAIRDVRTARAKSSHGVHMAQQLGLGVRKQIGEKNYQQVIDAIEAGNIKSLPKELQSHAVAVRSQMRYANRLRKQAGIRGGERKNYLPHIVEPHALEVMGKTPKAMGAGVGRKTIRLASSKARKRKGTLAELRQTHPGEYSENLAQIVANRMAEGHVGVARAELNQALAKQGEALGRRLVTHGGEKIGYALGPHEAAYHVVGSDISGPLSHQDLKAVMETGSHKGAQRGRYVVLNEKVVSRATEGMAPKLKDKGLAHGYDQAQAAFKRIATFTPGFHVRNIVGDLQNAYLGQGAHKLPGNMVRAGRVLKAYGRQEKALKNLSPEQVGKATLKTKRYGNVTYDEVAKQLRNHGAFRSGYIARELPELEHAGMQTEAKLKKVRMPQSAKRAALAREDLPRLTTAMQALREGATYQEAAHRVADLHFDYQHLTNFERTFMRRAMPFYTWSARNIPLQLKTLVTKPGKYAHIQALREEAAKASGVNQQDQRTAHLYHQLQLAGVKLPAQWERFLSSYEQRNAGIPISWKGHRFTLSAGLPFTDIGYVPGVAGAGDFADRAAQLVTPILKDPVEYAINYSFFFHDQIQNDNSPLVKAPVEVAAFPASMKKRLGVVKITDKKTGKRVWAWPGKIDYVAHTVPGLPSQALQFSRPGGRADAGTAGRVGSVVGAKVTPIDPVKNAVDLAYRRQKAIQNEMAGLRQQGVSAKNPNGQYRKLNEQLKIVNEIIYQGKQSQGYKVLPTIGGPSSASGSQSSGFDFSGAGSSSSGGSGSFDFSGAGG